MRSRQPGKITPCAHGVFSRIELAYGYKLHLINFKFLNRTLDSAVRTLVVGSCADYEIQAGTAIDRLTLTGYRGLVFIVIFIVVLILILIGLSVGLSLKLLNQDYILLTVQLL